MATNTVYVFAKKDSKYASTGEYRSCLENSSQLPVLYGLACWQEEGRYGLGYDMLLFFHSFVSCFAFLVKKRFSGACNWYYVLDIIIITM